MQPELCYVVPVHNEAGSLAGEVEQLRQRLERWPAPTEILLVENGSRDDSARVAAGLEGSFGRLRIASYTIPQAGIGYAYDLGIREAWKQDGQESPWIVLTGADLPFGFSDLEAFSAWHEARPDGEFAIGSKAHPASQVRRTLKRRLSTWGYRQLRRRILRMRTGDPQGSMLLRSSLAKRLAPRIRTRGFFYSTELVYWSELEGIFPVELPVVVREEVRPSTVRLFHDSARILGEMVRLRRSSGPIP